MKPCIYALLSVCAMTFGEAKAMNNILTTSTHLTAAATPPAESPVATAASKQAPATTRYGWATR